MKNIEQWKPSKYIYNKNKLIASRDSKEVAVSSRLCADLIASKYDVFLKLYAKGKLLDLGCGNVPLYIAYKELVSSNVCVDWENTWHKNAYLDFNCDLSKPLPFANGEFDTIILSDVLEHIAEPEQLWQEMARILAPGGKIIMNVPFYYWLHEQPNDYYRYTKFALNRFVKNSELSLVHLSPIGGAPEIMCDIFAKNALVFIPIFGKAIASISQSLTMFFISTKLGAKLSKVTSDNFPLGYFLIAEK